MSKGMDQNRRLDSWKEIADYLGRDVRTVIRWEKEKSLPVHRLPGGKRQGVFAYSEEIDQWMLGHGDEPVTPIGDTGIDSGTAAPAVAAKHAKPFPAGLALGVAALLVLVLLGTVLWLDREPSVAAGPAPLERPLHFVRADYEAGGPRGIVAGDFNGDQKVDLAFTESLKGTVVVLLGDGVGAFPHRRTSATSLKSPEHIAAGDFNNDGKLDVAVTSYFGGREVEVLLGKGDGRLEPHFRFDAGGRSRFLVAGDLNGDGHLDLAVAASTAGQLIVLFGKGDGDFREGGRYEAERDVAALALVDLNGDSALDIVACDYYAARGSSVSVYLNAKDGTFPTRQRFPTGSGPLGVAVADLNNDTHPDVVTANFPQTGSILFGNGAAGFVEPLGFEAGRGNGFVQIADLDRDGILDILVLGEHSNTVTILLGNGRGGFQQLQDLPTGAYPDGAVVADFDRDRRLDLAVMNVNGESISVFTNRGETASRRSRLVRLIWPSVN